MENPKMHFVDIGKTVADIAIRNNKKEIASFKRLVIVSKC